MMYKKLWNNNYHNVQDIVRATLQSRSRNPNDLIPTSSQRSSLFSEENNTSRIYDHSEDIPNTSMHELIDISLSSILKDDTEDFIKTCYDAENVTRNNMAFTPSQRYKLRPNRTSLDREHIVTGSDFMYDSDNSMYDSNNSIKFNQTLSQTSTEKILSIARTISYSTKYNF